MRPKSRTLGLNNKAQLNLKIHLEEGTLANKGLVQEHSLSLKYHAFHIVNCKEKSKEFRSLFWNPTEPTTHYSIYLSMTVSFQSFQYYHRKVLENGQAYFLPVRLCYCFFSCFLIITRRMIGTLDLLLNTQIPPRHARTRQTKVMKLYTHSSDLR